jgi:hypothetical protein
MIRTVEASNFVSTDASWQVPWLEDLASSRLKLTTPALKQRG